MAVDLLQVHSDAAVAYVQPARLGHAYSLVPLGQSGELPGHSYFVPKWSLRGSGNTAARKNHALDVVVILAVLAVHAWCWATC